MPVTRPSLPLLLCVSVLSAPLFAQTAHLSGHHPTLLVANQKDRTLSFIDPVAHERIAVVEVGGITGHEVTTSADGRTAYVPIYGNSGVGHPGTDGQTMAVIDIASHKLLSTIDFGHPVRPHLPRINPTDHLLYVSTELDNALTQVDPKSLKVVGKVPTGQPESHMFVFSKDGRFAYTANVGPGSVSVIDLHARKVVDTIQISKNTQRISLSRDGKYIFTSDQTSPRLAVINASTHKIDHWVDLPGVGYGTASTQDGRFLLICIEKLKQIAVVDLSTYTVARTLDTPGVPTELLVQPDGKVAWVSCGQLVAAIDLADWKVGASVDSGKGADGLAWAR